MEKQEVVKFVKEVVDEGNAAYCLINGGGVSCLGGENLKSLSDAIMSDEYGDPQIISKGEEPSDFASVMSDEYDGTKAFVRVPHMTKYNEENQDIWLQFYDL